LNLQESRGIGIDFDTNIDKIIKDIDSMMLLKESDNLRINELEQIINQLDKKESMKNFLEIGFRVPKIQSYYKKNMNMKTCGVDINNFNVELFRELGYNVFKFDLNTDENIENKVKMNFDLVCCYHVLEHVEDPEKALQVIFKSMNSEGILHIEIPIERDQPQLEYGHLIGFEPNELGNLINKMGHKVIYASNNTHTGGSWIERYAVIK